MKKMNLILKKCKSISKQLGRSYSCSSLRSQSARDEINLSARSTLIREDEQNPRFESVFVGSTKKHYVISKQHLKHPLLKALIEKDHNNGGDGKSVILVKCEVVLFDHLLWMLENGDQKNILESLDELADSISLCELVVSHY